MTTSTSVERRRRFARRALLSVTTILCSGLVAPALAQQAGQTSGDALNAPSYNPVDVNGVDLLSGRFTARSPQLSMGSESDPSTFYLTWIGQQWVPNTPRLWLDKNWHVIVEFNGQSDEFADATLKDVPNQPSGQGHRYVYAQKRPNVGAGLACYFTGPISGTQWIDNCLYVSRQGVSISFYGVVPYNGSYPAASQYDYEAYGNTRAWPGQMSDPSHGRVNYLTNSPVQVTGNSTGGLIAINYPNGIRVSNEKFVATLQSGDDYYGNYPVYYNRTAVFTMVNQAVPGVSQTLTIVTPSLDGSDRTKSYLRPKGTTQTFADALGRVTSYTFDGNGNMTRVVTPAGVAADLTYDGSHRVSTYSINGSRWSYSYDFADSSTGGGTTTVTDLNRKTKRVAHLARPGPVTSVVDELSRTASYSYDSYDRLMSSTRPDGDNTSYHYDGNGNLDTVTVNPRPSVGGTPLVTTATYPSDCSQSWCHKPMEVVDPNGNATDYTYGVGGFPATITEPAGSDGTRPQVRNTYAQMGYYYKDSNGNITQTTGRTVPVLTQTSVCQTKASCANTSDEVRAVYTYGFQDGTAANNLLPTSMTKQLGDNTVLAQTLNGYDGIGNLVTVDGPLPGSADTTRMIYDAARQKVGEIGPDPDGTDPLTPVATRTTYNSDGRPTLVEQGNVTDQSDGAWAQFSANQRTAMAYDQAGRPTTVVSAGTGASLTAAETSYDVLGRTLCTATRMNTTVFPSIGAGGATSGGGLTGDACSRNTDSDSNPDRITRNEYDAGGQLVQVRKAVGTTIEQAYATYDYSPNGKRTTVIDANGNQAQMTYDGFDRELRWYFPSSTGPTSFDSSSQARALQTVGAVNTSDYEEYGYDGVGNRTSWRKRDGRTFGFTFDALNRIAKKTVPAGCAPNQVGVCPDGSATRDVFYTYNLQGLQTGAHFDTPDGGDSVLSGYDGLGRLTSSTTAMNGTSRALASQYDAAGGRTQLTYPDSQIFSYVRDALDRVTSITQPDQASIAKTNYDVQGRLLTTTKSGASTSYGYDDLSRLNSHTLSYSGSLGLTTGLEYNPASQITKRTQDNDAYAFTGGYNSNRQYVPNGLNQYASVGSASLGYDANGNLISDGTTSYGYDAENRLVSASNGAQLIYDPLGRLWQTSGGPAQATQFLYHGDALVSEYGASGTMLRRYVHTDGQDKPLIWYEGAGFADRRGLQTDPQGSVVSIADASGRVNGINSYDEYGTPAFGNQGRFQYTGQAWLPELGMYNYKARIYSPKLGRFLQTDPVGYEDQINLYSYGGGDPVNLLDPDGKRITLAIHEAIPYTAEYHAKIVIIPDDQEAFRSDPRFQVNSNGTVFSTIGAGPDTSFNVFGPLVGGVNRDRDVKMLSNGKTLTVADIRPGKGDTENTLINRMLNVAESYKNDKPYELFPDSSPHELLGKPHDDGYNSNSFAYGLLKALGVEYLPVPFGYNIPGSEKPLPSNEFCSVTYTGC